MGKNDINEEEIDIERMRSSVINSDFMFKTEEKKEEKKSEKENNSTKTKEEDKPKTPSLPPLPDLPPLPKMPSDEKQPFVDNPIVPIDEYNKEKNKAPVISEKDLKNVIQMQNDVRDGKFSFVKDLEKKDGKSYIDKNVGKVEEKTNIIKQTFGPKSEIVEEAKNNLEKTSKEIIKEEIIKDKEEDNLFNDYIGGLSYSVENSEVEDILFGDNESIDNDEEDNELFDNDEIENLEDEEEFDIEEDLEDEIENSDGSENIEEDEKILVHIKTFEEELEEDYNNFSLKSKDLFIKYIKKFIKKELHYSSQCIKRAKLSFNNSKKESYVPAILNFIFVFIPALFAAGASIIFAIFLFLIFLLKLILLTFIRFLIKISKKLKDNANYIKNKFMPNRYSKWYQKLIAVFAFGLLLSINGILFLLVDGILLPLNIAKLVEKYTSTTMNLLKESLVSFLRFPADLSLASLRRLGLVDRMGKETKLKKIAPKSKNISKNKLLKKQKIKGKTFEKSKEKGFKKDKYKGKEISKVKDTKLLEKIEEKSAIKTDKVIDKEEAIIDKAIKNSKFSFNDVEKELEAPKSKIAEKLENIDDGPRNADLIDKSRDVHRNNNEFMIGDDLMRETSEILKDLKEAVLEAKNTTPDKQNDMEDQRKMYADLMAENPEFAKIVNSDMTTEEATKSLESKNQEMLQELNQNKSEGYQKGLEQNGIEDNKNVLDQDLQKEYIELMKNNPEFQQAMSTSNDVEGAIEALNGLIDKKEKNLVLDNNVKNAKTNFNRSLDKDIAKPVRENNLNGNFTRSTRLGGDNSKIFNGAANVAKKTTNTLENSSKQKGLRRL